MSLYEVTFIVRQDVSAGEVDEVAAAVEKVVEQAEASLQKKEKWGLLNLAYPIKKNNKGHYIHLLVEGGPDLPGKLQKEFKKRSDVIIRSLVVEADEGEGVPDKKEPSHMMRDRKSAA